MENISSVWVTPNPSDFFVCSEASNVETGMVVSFYMKMTVRFHLLETIQ